MADYRYVVPPHQRDFSWTSEEVKQLWDDITEAMKDGRPEYFLGTIVVTEDREERLRAVIDGQQRLATLTMMLAAIRSVYEEHGDDRAQEVYAEYLGAKDRRTRLTEPRLTLNRTNQTTFQELVVDHTGLESLVNAKKGNIAPSNRLLIDAAHFVRGVINERVRGSKQYETFALELEDFIRDRVILILVAVSDEADAYLIFETLNDRGLDLSISDLLKNYMYGRAMNRLEQVQRQWEEMIVLLGTQDATQFLRHYWLSRYGVVRERDLYRELKVKFANSQQVLTLMTQLRDAADKYAAISTVDHPIWKGYGTQLRRDLEALQLFAPISQFRPLLLAALEVLPDGEVEKVVRMVVVLSMRYSVIGQMGTGNIERAYSEAAVAIRDGKANTAAKIFGLVKGTIYPDDERFKADFATKTVTRAKLARYILAGVANAVQPATDLEVVQDEKKVNLEHVMPKTSSAEWSNAATDEAEYLAHVDRIGNMTLIERDVNSAAGNASFERKKKDAFSKSNIVITKQLCAYDGWTTREITNRQSLLADTAALVWSVNY
jgi:hypothetical protein